jgi:hypothetical protein
MRPVVPVVRRRKTGRNAFRRIWRPMIAMPNTPLRSMRRPMSQSPPKPEIVSGCKSKLKSGSAGRSVWVPILAALLLYGPINGFAAEPLRCLTGDEQRAAIANGKTVPLATVIHMLRRAPKDVIKAQLCQEPERLVYKLTLLGRDGKVKRAIVDASNGAVVGER